MKRVDPWLALLTGLIVALGGGTGVATLLRVRSDKKIAESAAEVNEETAVSTHLLALIDKQTQVIVKPLEDRLKAAESKIGELESKLQSREEENRILQTRYWHAVQFIREMQHWIRRNCTTDGAPTPHSLIADDI